MICAMIEGVRDPRKLAALAGRGLKVTPKQLHWFLPSEARQSRVRDDAWIATAARAASR
jgi:hypothetical protein